MNPSNPKQQGAKADFTVKREGYLRFLFKELRKNKYLYFMVLPVVAYYAIFHYIPMYGAQIAFRDFNAGATILSSPWVGFKYFLEFFNSYYFGRVIRNTILLSVYSLVFSFPAPILFALLLNEIKNRAFKSVVQTVSYLPHFISLVVICGMIIDFLKPTGIINSIIQAIGMSDEPIRFMTDSDWFRTVYIVSGIWQGVGWGSIIYLAALTGIDPTLYEASVIDGANRLKQVVHITLPGLLPTIVILFIMNIGHLMSIGGEKIILLYNPATYETADVISSFVYRRGIQEANFSYSAAVGLFNSVINFILLITVNKLGKKVTGNSLW